jgi:hypothetical protein
MNFYKTKPAANIFRVYSIQGKKASNAAEQDENKFSVNLEVS